jgi:transposase InsO family protein
MGGEPQAGVGASCARSRSFARKGAPIEGHHRLGSLLEEISEPALKEVLIDAPDTAWSADITYVRLSTSLCYLASIIDEYSR